MEKEIIKNIKVFAASALLAGSIVLSGCSSTKTLSDYTDEEITEEYERRINEENSNTKTKIFEPGEHVLQTIEEYNISNFIHENQAINCPEGYELISTWADRICDNIYIGYTYRNTQPVNAKADENGEYTVFGTPIEMEKTPDTQKVRTK